MTDDEMQDSSAAEQLSFEEMQASVAMLCVSEADIAAGRLFEVDYVFNEIAKEFGFRRSRDRSNLEENGQAPSFPT